MSLGTRLDEGPLTTREAAGLSGTGSTVSPSSPPALSASPAVGAA